jgi:hypothetical protein
MTLLSLTKGRIKFPVESSSRVQGWSFICMQQYVVETQKAGVA